MAPPFVFRALVFGLVVGAVVLGMDLLATDVLKWGWLHDPTHVPFGWRPPHLQVHKVVFALSAGGSLAGMFFSKEGPLPWRLLLLAAALFGLATLVGAPVAFFMEEEIGVGLWLAGGSLLAIMLTHAER